MIGIGWLQVIIGWPLYQLCLGPPLASPSDLPPAMIVGQATGAYMAWLSLPMWSAAFLAYVLALRRRRRELSASGKTSGEPQIVMPLPPHDTGASLGNGRLFQIQNAED